MYYLAFLHEQFQTFGISLVQSQEDADVLIVKTTLFVFIIFIAQLTIWNNKIP